MTTNKNNTQPPARNVVSLRGSETAKPITDPQDFLRLAESLVSFEKRGNASDSDKPAPRVASLDGFAGKGKPVRFPGSDVEAVQDDASSVTPFPVAKGKPPSPGTT